MTTPSDIAMTPQAAEALRLERARLTGKIEAIDWMLEQCRPRGPCMTELARHISGPTAPAIKVDGQPIAAPTVAPSLEKIQVRRGPVVNPPSAAKPYGTNRERVQALLRQRGPMTRSEIAHATGMSEETVNALLATVWAFETCGEKDGKRGMKPKLWRVKGSGPQEPTPPAAGGGVVPGGDEVAGAVPEVVDGGGVAKSMQNPPADPPQHVEPPAPDVTAPAGIEMPPPPKVGQVWRGKDNSVRTVKELTPTSTGGYFVGYTAGAGGNTMGKTTWEKWAAGAKCVREPKA